MAGWWEQLMVFTLRSFNQQLVMIVNLATDLFLVCCAGAVLGMVYFDSAAEEDLLQTISLSCLVVRVVALRKATRCTCITLFVAIATGRHDRHHLIPTLVFQGGHRVPS